MALVSLVILEIIFSGLIFQVSLSESIKTGFAPTYATELLLPHNVGNITSSLGPIPKNVKPNEVQQFHC